MYMKTKTTITMIFSLFFIMGMIAQGFAQQAKDNENSNFTYIDDFEEGVAMWWLPQGAGQTTGIILEDDEGNLLTYREQDTIIVNPQTGSTASMKLAFAWDEDVEWFEPTAAGSQSHFIRQYMPPGNANVPERHFFPGQAIEVFLYGDGSGNRFRFMVRDGANTLEGSDWYTVSWSGWKRLTWDYNDAANVFGWVNGNGEMTEGNPFYFDSFMITRNESGTTSDGLFYFDDLRIVDPFNVEFNIAGADGSEIIEINNITYEAGETEFSFFPGEYQYFIRKEGFVTYIGTFEVDDQDLVIDVTLDSGDDPEFTVNFTVLSEDEELITDAIITLGDVTNDVGDYEFTVTPGFYNYTVSKELYFDTEGFVTVIGSNIFVNVILQEIPDIFYNVYLSWDVAPTAASSALRQEHYSVWVSTSDADTLTPENSVMIFEETLSSSHPQWGYQARQVEISQFAEQDIRVAFRHHNVTGKDRIIISNIEISGPEPGETEPTVLLFEDFEGGLPEGFNPETFDPTVPGAYDPNWLPEGWASIDYNEDDFKWDFGIYVDQNLDYKTFMVSRSFDASTGNDLTPDNWLVTPMVEIPMVFFYDVEFIVTDEDGNAITDAVITLNGQEFDSGQYTFVLTNGDYDYEVSLEAYEIVSGSFTVEGEDLEIEVTLTIIPLYDVTFNVNMNQADGFEPGETEVYFTGAFFDWAVPGTVEGQQLNPTDNIYIFTQTLHLPAGTYEYKYFDGPSFDDDEWPGDPNRVIEVTDNMVINDIFGVQTSVDELTENIVNLFPNPANRQVNVTSGSRIMEVAVYNIAGQQVYRHTPDTQSHIIDLNAFHNGIYMVRVLTLEGLQTMKLQVVK
ncbi:MAG: T9SS C-terminal target domain-containing protein [Bacteroidetes bacterium]|nr:MAG: T9SS C-terminal target domain-containing protein [Bacteroidota bacterium]